MSHPNDNLPEASEILSILPNLSLDRRTFLLGTPALLALSNPAEAQTNNLKNVRPDLTRMKPYLMSQLGHHDSIFSVAISPDGKIVLTGGSDSAARLWQMETGKEIRRFEGHTSVVFSVTFSPNGRFVLTGGYDGIARLWQMETGKEIRKFEGHASDVNSVAFSPDGRLVLTGSGGFRGSDWTARLWQTETGKEVRRFEGHVSGVSSVAFSPNGKFVLTGSIDKTARLWQIETGKEIRKFEGHSADVSSVAFSPGSKFVLTGSIDKTARLWQTETGKEVRRFEGHSHDVNSVAFSPDGKFVLTGSRDKTARLWQIETGKEIRKFEGHFASVNSVAFSDGVNSVAFSPDGKFVLAGNYGGVTRLWQTDTGKEIRRFEGKWNVVRSVAFSPDGRYMLTGNMDKIAHLWQTDTGKEIRKFEGHSNVVRSVAFSPDGKFVLTGSIDKTARLWQTETGKEVRRFEGHSDDVNSVAFSPDGRLVLTGSMDKTARLWQTDTGKEIRKFEGHSSWVNSVAFSPDGRFVLTGGYDSTARLWQMETGKEIRRFVGHSNRVNSVAFSPDGRLVLTGSMDKTARLWQTDTGKEISKFEGHSADVNSVAFSPDGKFVLTGNYSGVTRLWQTETGKEIRKFEGHALYLNSVAFSPDGKFVLTGNGDSTSRLWGTDTGKELCSLISFRDGAWAVTDNEGRYDASNGGDVEGLHWVVRNQAIDLKQLKQRYYMPGLMANIFQGKKLPEVAAFDNVPMYPAVTLPESMPASGKVAITLLNQDGGIGKVQILLNGKEVQGDARGPKPNPNTDKLTLAFDLAPYRALLLPGKANVLEVVAYNGENWLASRGIQCEIHLPNEKPADKPRLYAIIGGINDYAAPELHLRFAAKDAEDFAAALALGAKRLFGVGQVEIVRLTGAPGALAPSRANFARAFADARKLRAQDVLVVYLAGHGVALGKGSDLYCYLTQEARAADSVTLSDLALRQKTTITSEELTDWIKQVNAHKQVMILDTCSAGAAAVKLTEKRDINGDQVRALDRLKDRTGFYVLMGCAADRVSYEATRYGQGVLTYALLQGMKGAKLREGKFVDVSSLFDYVVDNVPRLAGEIGGIQRPQVCAPTGGASFDVGQMEREDQEKVPLEKTYPLILRPNLTDIDAGFDSLKLAPRLRKRLNDLLQPETRGNSDTARVVYVDAEEMPGAITPNATYTVQGDTVKVRLVLRQDDKTVETLTLEGTRSDSETLVARLTRAIAEAAQKH